MIHQKSVNVIAQNITKKRASLVLSSLVVLTICYIFFQSTTYNSPHHHVTELDLTLPKSTAPKTIATPQHQWHNIEVKPGDNLSSLLRPFRVSPKTIHAIMQLGPIVQPLGKLKASDKLFIQLNEHGTLKQLNYPLTTSTTLTIQQAANGWNAELRHTPIEKRVYYTTGQIKNSLISAGLEAGLSEQMIFAIADIFACNIDFAKDIRVGDRFTLIYEAHYVNDQRVEGGHIIAAEFICQNKTHQAIRYTNSKGNADYYHPNGQSVRRAFLRTPVKFTRISSQYAAARKHPILHTIRRHAGVDYAAPTGTPVKASGQGMIAFIGKRGGYGRMIEIKHGRKYSTRYAHLSRYQRGLKVGSTVHQGQVIGFVGQSGLADGPHLHYEFRIHGRHVNPQTVQLPKADAIPKKQMANFKAIAHPLLAQLKLYRQGSHFQA